MLYYAEKRRPAKFVCAGAILFATACLYASVPAPPARVTRDLGGVSGNFLPSQSMTGSVTAEPMALHANEQQFFSHTSGDFQVMRWENGHDTELAYEVEGTWFTNRNRMKVHDAFGKSVALIQKKLLTMHEEYWIYRYTPNRPGQSSTEKDDKGVPMYRFAFVQQAMFAWSSEFYYYLFDGNDIVDDAVLLAKGIHEWVGLAGRIESRLDIKRPGGGQPIVGALSRVSMSEWHAVMGRSSGPGLFGDSRMDIKDPDGNANWVLELAKGMDKLGMLCMALAIHQITEDGASIDSNDDSYDS